MRILPSADRALSRRVLLLILITALGSAFLGCAGRRVAPFHPPGDAYLSPDDALRALAVSAPGDQTLTVTARIEINAHGQRRPLKAAMMMRKPANLRLESVPLLGPPDFFLSIDAGELRVFSPENNGGIFYIGRSTARNVNRFFPLALPAADMVSLLMGQPPAMEEDSSLRGEWEEGLYRVDRYIAGEKTLSLWIDPAGDRLLRVRAFTEGGDIAYTAEFADHTSVGKSFLPQRLTITGEAVSLSLRYTEVRLDNDSEPFALPIPEGVEPISLD
ncbi:MAG TPA: hypothetical protein DCZ97_01295 [Syntrophus sp. (in: bacteria)]|nr:MAG: hypothetical protein A2X92_01305 [Syntrophus sp. GWC2_56_31]HBB15683.1 hypothetical protein [Syntrophus sp. (in: bacteria)]